ncbi:hypothetical protein ACFL5Q_06225 [Planctomycetota bacterium]
MMTVPNLPTDNLYKFIGVAGLVLAVASVAWVELGLSRARQEAAEAEGRLNALEFRAKVLLEVRKALPEALPGGDLEEAVENELIALKEELPTLNVIEEKARGRRWSGYAGLGFGLALMLVGGFFWYVRLQKYQDILIRGQAEKIGQTPDAP